jgi:hypothetical protein
MESNKIIVFECIDRECIHNNSFTDICGIWKKITMVKGKCVDKIKSKVGNYEKRKNS